VKRESDAMNEWIEKLERQLGYCFRDKTLLIRALTHSTYTYEQNKDFTENNERLEFLGDSVLALIIGDFLFRHSDSYKEGVMSKIRSLVVCESTLCEVAQSLSLGCFLLLGKGEEQTLGRNKHSNLSNAMEAVIAAIYIDGGLEEATRFVSKVFHTYIQRAMKGKLVYDYKSIFLEYLQSEKLQDRVSFHIVREEGPEHCRTFYAQVVFQETVMGNGVGATKKEAEQEAAREAYCQFRTNEQTVWRQ
jgi:ribonuclease III